MVETIIGSIVGVVTAAIVGVVGLYGHRVQKKNAADDGWVKQFDALTTRMDAEIQRLDSEVDSLRDELRLERSRFQAAVSYIRSLRLWIREHVPGENPPDIPERLQEEI